ncbi:MAG: Clp protease N-terminal domain-containing protein [Patescibacteria group bacterium]|nr:Clp protease N-terminal domain-containing protein [Patescibacteria group bacterium]
MADKNKDEFTTEEHLLLALIEYSDDKVKDIFKTFDITYVKVKEIIDKMRG